jgi:CDP-glucose 4,6-dehydratase
MVNEFRQAFGGRRVFLTGHTGFKGGWLAVWLKQLGAEVHGYSLAPETPSFYASAGVSEGLRETIADLRDLSALRAALNDSQPEVILHLAAQPLVRRSYAEPLETFTTNVIGTANLLEAARGADGLRAVVVVTSDKCYENREWLWPYRESEALGGSDPYSASKGCTEIVAASFRRSFYDQPGAAGVATCRAGNVFGGGDWAADRLIPDIARAITRGEPVKLRNPSSVRPWQHVLEPLRGYLLVAARLLAGDRKAACAWNFGPGPDAEVPVGEVAARLIKRWGQGKIVVAPEANAVHEARLLRLDISQAAALLGWRPRLPLAEGLDWTAEWYQCAMDRPQDLRALTLDQIARYEALCATEPHVL